MSRILKHTLTSLTFVIIGAASPAFGQPIDVLTFDGSRTLNPFGSSAGYSQLRSDLLNSAKFGLGGVVPRTVESITAVPTITASALDGVEVVILVHIGSALTAAENSALLAFLHAGGGLLVADNSAAQTLQPLLGVQAGAFTNSGIAAVSNPSSPLASGPFGNFGTGVSINTGFAGSFDLAGLTAAGTGALTNSEGFFAASFAVGSGRVAAFTDEEAFANSGFVGGDANLGSTSEALFLNSFAHVAAVPEPSQAALLAAGLVLVGYVASRRNKSAK